MHVNRYLIYQMLNRIVIVLLEYKTQHWLTVSNKNIQIFKKLII